MEYRRPRQVSPALAQYTFLSALACCEFRSSIIDVLTLLAQYGLFKKPDVSKEAAPVSLRCFSPGEMINVHMYHYAGNNPVKYVDPDGEAINFVIGAVIGAATNAVINIAGQYFDAQITGQEFNIDLAQVGAAALGGAIAGAITSGTSAVASLTCQPLAQAVMATGGAFAGAAGNAVSTVAENAMKGNDLTQDLKENVIRGTITGGIAGASTTAPKVSHNIDKLGILTSSTGSTLRREILKEGTNLAKDEGISRVVDFIRDKSNN